MVAVFLGSRERRWPCKMQQGKDFRNASKLHSASAAKIMPAVSEWKKMLRI